MVISIDELRGFAGRCFESAGVPATAASTAAGVLSGTDAFGVFTHGTKLLSGYLKKLYGGGYAAVRSRVLSGVEVGGRFWTVVRGSVR